MKIKANLKKWIQFLAILPVIPFFLYMTWLNFEAENYIKIIVIVIGGILLKLVYVLLTKKSIIDEDVNPIFVYQLGYLFGSLYLGIGLLSFVMNLFNIINQGIGMLTGFHLILNSFIVLGLIIIYLSKRLKEEIYKK